jgi:acyl carrier protein
MTPEEILARVCGVSPEIIDDETSNSSLPEWDSLAHVILVMELEAAYNVRLSVDDALALTSVQAIRNMLLARGVTW